MTIGLSPRESPSDLAAITGAAASDAARNVSSAKRVKFKIVNG